jgi:chemotaxis protein CheX
MQSEFVEPIVQAAYEVLGEILATDISRGNLEKRRDVLPLHRISTLAGLNGRVEGYVLLSLPLDLALSIGEVIAAEEVLELDEVPQAAIVGLMDTIMAEAVGQLPEGEVTACATPAALFWGQGVQLSCSEIEAAVIPLQMPLGTIELTVALREPGK